MSNAKAAIHPPLINPWFIAITITLATFMELLDTPIANVALSYIGGGLSRSYDEVIWILRTYLVANAVVLPTSPGSAGSLEGKITISDASHCLR
jgi:hypothetical protein